MLIIGAAGTVALGISQNKSENETAETVIITKSRYAELANRLDKEIDRLSPTPSAEPSWTVTKISYAPDSPFVYVHYTDSFSLMRLLLRLEDQDGRENFRVLATFQYDNNSDAWHLNNGQDIARREPLINYYFDPETLIWVGKDDEL